MRIKKLPENFHPISEGLIYDIEAEDTIGAVDVEIMDVKAGKPLGLKRYPAAGLIRANMTNYVTRQLNPKPASASGFHFFSDDGRKISIAVKAGNTVSEERVFIYTQSRVMDCDILSKLPGKRKLALGERDEISILIESNAGFKAQLTTTGDKGLILETAEFESDCGIVTLLVDSLDIFNSARRRGHSYTDCRSAKVRIYVREQLIGDIEYELCNSLPGQKRICWLNSLGGIDFHTFHAVTGDNISIVKQRIISGGAFRTVASSVEKTSELISDYCISPLSDALMELACSERVWLVDSNDLIVPVDVITDKITASNDSPFNLRLTIRESTKRQCDN